VRLERLGNWKNSYTSLGLKPATFQLVTQCLNHYITACPPPFPVRVDTFYNSLSLAKTLKLIHETHCVGTQKLNQNNVSIRVKNTQGPCSGHKMEWQKNHNYDFLISSQTCFSVGLQSMIGDDLKDQLLHSYLAERKWMTKWLMMLFWRSLNILLLNIKTIYRNNTGRENTQLSIIIKWNEGLFVKYANTVDYSGRISPENTVPCLTDM
jgi:hypothetical protein